MGKAKKRKQIPKDGGDKLNSDVQAAERSPNKIVICKNAGCHDIATTKELCRFHYLASWKKLKTKEAKKKGQELKQYLDDLARKFPEEFLQKLRSDVEEMAEREELSDSEDSGERAALFDQMEDDEDMDHIIQGLKVEDY